MECPSCKRNIVEDSQSCLFCGYKFNDDAEEIKNDNVSNDINSINQSNCNSNGKNNEIYKNKNRVSVFLLVCFFAMLTVSFIAGVNLGNSDISSEDFNFGIAFSVWIGGSLVSALFLGLSEIISLLQDLSDKK